MRGGLRKVHRMRLTVETKTQRGGCLKHACEECRDDVHRLASIAERLAIMKSDQDGTVSPLVEDTQRLIARLGLVREKINARWGPPASFTLARGVEASGPDGAAPQVPTPETGDHPDEAPSIQHRLDSRPADP